MKYILLQINRNFDVVVLTTFCVTIQFVFDGNNGFKLFWFNDSNFIVAKLWYTLHWFFGVIKYILFIGADIVYSSSSSSLLWLILSSILWLINGDWSIVFWLFWCVVYWNVFKLICLSDLKTLIYLFMV